MGGGCRFNSYEALKSTQYSTQGFTKDLSIA